MDNKIIVRKTDVNDKHMNPALTIKCKKNLKLHTHSVNEG